MDHNTKEVLDMLGGIVARMVTRDDIADMATKSDVAAMASKTDILNVRDEIAGLRGEVRELRGEVRDIRRQLEQLQQTVDSHSGYAKEIDGLMERISAIEQHLGLNRKIAA